MRETLIIIGNGMVGHKFIELLAERGATVRYDILVFGEETRPAYDRVHLSDYFADKSADDLALATREQYQAWGVHLFTGDKVQAVDRDAKTLTTASGRTVSYDKLVFATGSYPFVPPIIGKEATGTFVYRTLDDLDAIKAYAQAAQTGVVIGGGLLGLECANALRLLGLETHVVEFAPRLMPVQIDEQAGKLLRAKIEALGVRVHLNKSTSAIVAESGKVEKLTFADGGELLTDMVVFSAGIRPRDELARAAGLDLGERGGIAIRETCQTSDPDIYAIGECAAFQNKTYGLVAPGYQMAAAAADSLMSAMQPECFTGADMSTKLKLMGVDVASFGDAFAVTAGSREVSFADNVKGTYKKIVIDKRGKHLLGGILVGDAADYGLLHQMTQAKVVIPPCPEDLILPARHEGKSVGFGIDMLPDSAKVCSCENLSKGAICGAIRAHELSTVGEIKACTKAGTGCGGCVPMLNDILKVELKKAGKTVTNHLCEHFPFTRQELYHRVKVQGLRTFAEVLGACGKGGKGCEICKPVVASILASIWNDHILDKPHAPLQDSNDYFMANIQRDGTYSVVPRVAGGEITPDKLIVIGQVAKDFGLYVKITGGQRIDLFGARVDQLPAIWGRLVAAGFESGHAYGKALRTVKSCVGTTWCRYGQQDSVGFAIEVENRYKGLRAPHKLKGAVSGCTRECAEAQSKDFGLIATEKGYNLYVCGNGGMKPQHAQLLAEDLTEEQAIRYLDRFLMFYIRTADRLQRTAPWLNNLEGGLEYLKQVILDDSLGIADELERDMAAIVGTYQCEWKTTLADDEKLKRFRHFINSDTTDPNIVMVEERGQKRPAYPTEREALVPSGFVPVMDIS